MGNVSENLIHTSLLVGTIRRLAETRNSNRNILTRDAFKIGDFSLIYLFGHQLTVHRDPWDEMGVVSGRSVGNISSDKCYSFGLDRL